jgi:hypothetical protein
LFAFPRQGADRIGDHEQSRLLYLQASAEIETQRASFLHNDLRLTFFSGKQEVYRALVILSLADCEDESEAFTWCERAKARQLIDMLEHHLPIVRAHTDHTLLTRINHLRHELNSRYFQLRSETSALPVLVSADAIDSRESELNRCLREMADIDPEYVALQTASVVDARELQAALSPRMTLVEYFVAADEVLAFVVTDMTCKVYRHLCPISRVDYLTERFYGAWINRTGHGQDMSKNDAALSATANEFLHDFYTVLIAPLENDLQGDKLMVVPHGLMHYLPFHAFYDGRSYLTDRFDIVYAPSGSVLHHCIAGETKSSLLSIPGVMEPEPVLAPELAFEARGARVRISTDGEQTRESFLSSIPEADLIDISAECLLRPRQPFIFRIEDERRMGYGFGSFLCVLPHRNW